MMHMSYIYVQIFGMLACDLSTVNVLKKRKDNNN